MNDTTTQPLMIIHALKRMKSIKQEVEATRLMIAAHCADYQNESPVYGTPEAQSAQIVSWLKSIEDKLKNFSELSLRVQYTNLVTPVTIQITDDKRLTLPLQEWVLLRREITPIKSLVYGSIGDRSLKDKEVRTSAGATETVPVRRYYDPIHRDKMVMLYKTLPSVIDGHLEVVNATTPLLHLP